jgi:hypothetical protein
LGQFFKLVVRKITIIAKLWNRALFNYRLKLALPQLRRQNDQTQLTSALKIVITQTWLIKVAASLICWPNLTTLGFKILLVKVLRSLPNVESRTGIVSKSQKCKNNLICNCIFNLNPYTRHQFLLDKYKQKRTSIILKRKTNMSLWNTRN